MVSKSLRGYVKLNDSVNVGSEIVRFDEDFNELMFDMPILNYFKLETIFLIGYLVSSGSYAISQGEINATKEHKLIDTYKLAVKNGELDNQIDGLHNLASFYCNIGEYSNSEKYYKQVLELCSDNKRTFQLPRIQNNMVLLYEALGDFEKALDLSFETRDLAIEQNNDEELCGALVNIANIYLDVEDHGMALKYVNKAIEKDKDSIFFVSNLMTKAYLMTAVEKPMEAINCMNLALEFGENKRDSNELITIYNGYGNILGALGRNEESVFYHKQTLSISREMNNLQFQALSMVNITAQYLELSKLDSASIYADLGLDISEEIENPIYLMDFYEMKSSIYAQFGKHKDAYIYLKKYLSSYVKVINSENLSNIKSLEAKQELKIKEKKISLLRANERVSNLKISILIGFILFLIIIAFILYRSYRRKIKQREELKSTKLRLATFELERANLKKEQLSSELEYKDRELNKIAEKIIQNDNLLNKIKNELKSENGTNSNKLMRLISVGMRTDQEEFSARMDHINSLFYKKINEAYPGLSESDLRLLSLIKVNMTSKDIAIVLSINPKSVDMARYRLRKKMKLEKDVKLFDFLKDF